MPTAKRRHSVTETSEVATALDRAGHHFPAVAADRKALLLRLLALGDEALRSRERTGKRTDENRLQYLEDVSMRRIDAIDWDVLGDIDRLAWRTE